jgi:hypothetical protein
MNFLIKSETFQWKFKNSGSIIEKIEILSKNKKRKIQEKKLRGMVTKIQKYLSRGLKIRECPGQKAANLKLIFLK